MAFLELIKDSYQLTGYWRIVGVLWIPALCIAACALLPGIRSLRNILRKSTVLIMVFFLTRTWVSEPNIILVLPFIVILTSVGDLDRFTLIALWVLPLIFSILNTSTAQMFFPSMPDLMDKMLKWTETYRSVRLAAKTIIVIPWQLVGWWIVIRCFKSISSTPEIAVQ
jgi:hypothetical protein